MSQVDRILDKALKGERVTVEEGVRLFESDEIEKMGHVADQIMKRFHPEPITTFVIGPKYQLYELLRHLLPILRVLPPSGS